jgi:molybdate transport system permease protein
MPIAIYSLSGSGDWSKANVMVIFFTVISGIFLYIANRFSKRMV